jgi:hypothetical protein
LYPHKNYVRAIQANLHLLLLGLEKISKDNIDLKIASLDHASICSWELSYFAVYSSWIGQRLK